MPSTSSSQPTSGRPHILYISYDGVCEPLGRSQVLAYLVRLASNFQFTLVSFEKPDDDQAAVAAELGRHGIVWRPLQYHRRPPVLSTLLDVLAGRRAAVCAARRHGSPVLIHVRSYVPALIALLARRGIRRARRLGRAPKPALLFDIRGFWADERIEAGLWRPGGLLYRVAKRCERRFFAEADAIVTLTKASVPQIRTWTAGCSVPIDVIPTCVDVDRFAHTVARPGGPHVVWSGSVSTWYRFELTAKLANALSLPLTVITREKDLARELLGRYPAVVYSVAPEQVPDELFAGDVGLCLISPTFSKQASAPTRFAEYLAAGMPVVVTPGVGDLESIVADHGVGVVLRGEDPGSYAAAAAEVRVIAADRGARERCRRLARDLFDVDKGSACYATLYKRLSRG